MSWRMNSADRPSARPTRFPLAPLLIGVGILLGGIGSDVSSTAADQIAIDFGRDIRPILSNRCFQCHGPDEETREADLRLDNRLGAIADLGGYRAVDLDAPEASELLRRVRSTDPVEQMPPPETGLRVTPEEADLLERWIRQGAAYEPHWSFRPIARPGLPSNQLSTAESEWISNPIDHFVIAKLDEQGLTPSPLANRTTLIRRVYLDLLGLPPSAEEVSEFLADSSEDAYARMVDRALASPHYGERWGRHWLDQARYADTHGYTVDSDRSIWPYRDWVIHALNQDMPFDQFTVEQLAGDLLPDPSQEQLVATGFHRNTLINQEGGTDREQFRNEAVVDRVNTTGSVWLGLTLGCAQCHTHKFDPLTHHEYYRLFAFFNSGQDVNSVPPTLRVATPEQQEMLVDFDAQLRVAREALAEYDRERNSQLAEEERKREQPVEWTIIRSAETGADSGAELQQLGDGSFLVTGENATSDTYSVTFASPRPRITAVRLETLTHPNLPQGGPGRAANGNFVLTYVELTSGEQLAQWLHATADHSQQNYDVSGAIDADRAKGWAINVAKGVLNADRTASFVTQPVPTSDESSVTIKLHFGPHANPYNLGRFRISITDAPHANLDLPDAQRAILVAEQQRIESARQKFAASIPETMIMRELEKPRETHVLVRGDFLRKSDRVEAGTPEALPPLKSTLRGTNLDSTSPPTRLDLARWLVSDENPLTARVTVNRVWLRFFGQGLVETENDFGLQGTPPTHPELLDWLASEFREQGWSLKRLQRRILLSSTYRQSSHLRADLAVKDPLNKWIGRQVRLRLDAEVIRDVALCASGLFESRIGGPSVYPPQPDGVYAFTQSQRTWPTSQGSDRHRRGMYIFFMRSAPYPMLTTFDVPRFNTTCTVRVRSNTPLQSLTMANDEAIMEMARTLGRQLASQAGDDRERISAAMERCFARAPFPFELQRLLRYLEEQREGFAAAPDDARQVAGEGHVVDHAHTNSSIDETIEAAAWIAVARVLFNLDEFIIRE
jgi:mono/diheme cytochrome c family protein